MNDNKLMIDDNSIKEFFKFLCAKWCSFENYYLYISYTYVIGRISIFLFFIHNFNV